MGTLYVLWIEEVNISYDTIKTLSGGFGIIRLDNIESDAALTPQPDFTKEILGYEEMIEQYLIKSGGQAFQSEIVKESGLSKSKISIVLAKMKK